MSETSPQADPFGLVGTLLERKYRVDRAVAEGGFGVVYAGHHLALDLPVAIKVLKRRAGVTADSWQDLLSRFVQEAQTMARLRHPNVVAVLDTGVTETDAAPLPWMVLEWLEGDTLRDALLARRGRGGRSRDECLALMRPIVLAIAEAHEHGIAHRDLKPSNVMLVPTKRGIVPRVLDFGIAKVMQGERRATSGETTTQESVTAFSLSYAAPEQLAGTRTGPWTDVHALGLMLTEVLTDEAPYGGEDATAQHGDVFDPRRPTPAKRGVDVGAWEAILARAVALRPAERFQNAGELLAALEGRTEHPLAADVAEVANVTGTARPAPGAASAVFARPGDDRTETGVASESRGRPRSRAGLWVGGVGAVVVAGAIVGIGAAVREPSPAAAPSTSIATVLTTAPASSNAPDPASSAVAAPAPPTPASATALDAAILAPRSSAPPPATLPVPASARPSPSSLAAASVTLPASAATSPRLPPSATIAPPATPPSGRRNYVIQ